MVRQEFYRVAKEFKSQFELEPDKAREHHYLGLSAVKKEHYVIDKIKAFVAEGDKLHKVIAHAYILDEYVPSILNADVTSKPV